MKRTYTCILAYIALAPSLAGHPASADSLRGGGQDDPAERARLASVQRADQAAAEGMLLLVDGKVDRAEADFRQAIATRPDHEWAWYGLARVYALRGLPLDAMTAYGHLIRPVRSGAQGSRFTGPPLGGWSGWIATLEYAALLDRYGSSESGLALYQDVVAQNTSLGPNGDEPVLLPLYPEGAGPQSGAPRERLEALARVAVGIRRLRVLAAYPTWPPGAGPGSVLEAAQGRSPVDEFRAAVRLDPSSALAQFYLGLALYSRPGDRPEANRALDQAVHLGSDDIQAAVRELRATGKARRLPASACEERMRHWRDIVREWNAKRWGQR